MAALNQQRTFLQLQNSVAQILFNNTAASSTTYPTDTAIKELINKWYKDFYYRYRFLWNTGSATMVTVAGTSLITMPDDVMEVTNMNIRSIIRMIRYITRQLMLNNYPAGWTGLGNAVPLWAVEAPPASNNAIQFDLWPAPDAIYTINLDYYKRPAVLSADGDYPVLPPEIDSILIHGPASEALMMLGDPRAEYHQKMVEKLTREAWLRNEQMASSENTFRSLSNENIGGSYPGLLQPYLGQ